MDNGYKIVQFGQWLQNLTWVKREIKVGACKLAASLQQYVFLDQHL